MELRRPAICIVTRARGEAGSEARGALLDRLAAAAAAGATMIQVRERQFDDRQLLEFIRQVAAAVRHTNTLVTVNERTDVALASGADGVHLKSDGPDPRDVRRIVPAQFLIGRSVHSEAEAIAAAEQGASDYLFFGTVFRSASKTAGHPTTGLEGLERVCRRVSAPVLAIGGVTVRSARDVSLAGAAGIAALSLFAEAGDMAATVQALHGALTAASRDV